MKLKILTLIVIFLCAAGGGYFLWLSSQSRSQNSATATHQDLKSERDNEVEQLSSFRFLLDSSDSYEERVAPLRNLKLEELSENDINFLYSALSHHDHMHQEDWWVVLNEIMDRLGRIEDNPERYTAGLVGLIRNPEVHPVAKDYALQHLGNYYSPNLDSSGRTVATPEKTAEVLQVFVEAIVNPELSQSSAPGTGVTVLHSMKEAGVSDELLAPTIDQLTPWFTSTILGEREVPFSTRVTAINIAGEFKIESLKPVIREYVGTSSISPTIRLNAIAALGSFGDESDLGQLEQIAASSTKFRYAAQTALKNLNDEL